MTGYQLDDLLVIVFFISAFGAAGMVLVWAFKYLAFSFIEIHSEWSEARLKRENLKLVHPTESGLLPVARNLLDSGILADQVLALIAQRIETTRLPQPVPQSLTYAPHYAYRNDLKAEGQSIIDEAPTFAPQDFWALYTGGQLPSSGFLIGYQLDNGKPIFAQWTQLYSALIGGQSGSGKSTLVRSILAQSAMQRGQFLVLDKHYGAGEDSLGESLMPLRNSMIADPASSEREMLDCLGYAKDVGRRRLSGQDKDHTPLILVVDETTALFARSSINEQLGSLLAEIAQETRKVGVYALCIGQNFSSGIMNTTIRNSFVSMLTCRTRRDVARVMSGNTEFGKLAETLKTGQAIWLDPQGEMIRLAVPNTTQQHIALIGQTLSGGSVAPPNPVYPEETAVDASNSIKRVKTAVKLDLKAQRAIQMFMAGHTLKEIVSEAYGATSGEPYKQAVQTFMSVLRERLTHET